NDQVRHDLLAHARAVVHRQLKDRPALERVEAAETAVQETSRRALEKSADYDPARAVAAWLHGILVNVLFETVRELRRRPAQPPDDSAAWDRLASVLSPADEPAGDRLDAAGILSRLS